MAKLSHGHRTKYARTRTYRTWDGMVQRTTNPGHKSFAAYASLGIDPDFLGVGGFERFLAHVGERPKGKTLDRIDPERGYFKGNLRWATPKQQEANKVRAKHYGRTIAEWAELTGVLPSTVRKRIARGRNHLIIFPEHLRR